MSAKKSAPKKVVPVSDPLFIGVPDPANLRINLLETSKTLLVVLKHMETMKQIRVEKEDSMSAITSLIKEIKTSVNKLKKSLPSPTVLRSPHVKSPPVMKPKSYSKNSSTTKVVRKSFPKTELEKLESELAMIESKLTSI